MFNKKCSRCNEKISKNYEFCPFCGNNLVKKEDYGLLGKDDLDETMQDPFGSPMIDRVFKTATEMLEKQLKSISNETRNHALNKPQNLPHNNVDVQFYINGKKVNFSNKPKSIQPKIPIKKQIKEITKEQSKKLAKLPRKEPKTKMTRLAGKLVYELDVPGVNDINDILINQLENSIEIKAISKTKIYSKIININLPILGYKLNKPNLILELQSK